MEEENPFKKNRHEIKYKVINSLLAGALVFLGALTNGELNRAAFLAAAGASLVIMVTQFKEYWTSQEKEYCEGVACLGNFI